MSRVLGVSGDFPIQLATRLPDWSASGLQRCNAARLSVCRVVAEWCIHTHAALGLDGMVCAGN